jgi:FKBP-type peptidyl-prolyl cis-trans isomerase (trigger factor)
MENTTKTYDVKVKKLPASRIEITASIPAAEFDQTRGRAIKNIGKEITIDGFRKGHVPESILAGKIGEAAILEEMAEITIAAAYPSILIAEKIDALGRPEVAITKIAPGNPLEFTLTTAVFPEITLPDYKKLAAKEAKKKEEVAVDDDEVEKTITQIRKMRAEQKAQADGVEFDAEAPLPEIDDEYIKTLGAFNSVTELKAKLRENILAEKTRQARDKKRVSIMEAIVAEATIELPEIIIEQELHRMQDEFAHEIERMGMTFESYANAVGKTAEEMKKEWRPDAEKRAKVQLLTAKIAEEEKITPDADKLEQEVTGLKANYPEASEDRIRDYLTMILTNDKVFEFLEGQDN